MKIILDTNVLYRDYSLQSGWVLKLSDAAKKLGYEVCVPEVTVDEIFHQYYEELVKAYDKYTKGDGSINFAKADENNFPSKKS